MRYGIIGSLAGLLFSVTCWADEIFVLRNAMSAIYVNTYANVGPASAPLTGVFGLPSPVGWHEIDVTKFGVPAGATAVYLQGQINITGGQDAPVLCNAYVYLGDSEWMQTLNPALKVFRFGMGQAMTMFYGGGDRKMISSWVPVENGKFRWQWTRNTEGEWPEHCSYGLNFNLQGYTR